MSGAQFLDLTRLPAGPVGSGPGDLFALDRIVEFSAGQRGVALRGVPNTLAVLDSHFPRFPVLPGVLILGSMGRLASLVLDASGSRGWRLAGARRVRYRHFVGPGDVMEITVEITGTVDEEATAKATVRVDGRPVTTAATLRLVPADVVVGS